MRRRSHRFPQSSRATLGKNPGATPRMNNISKGGEQRLASLPSERSEGPMDLAPDCMGLCFAQDAARMWGEPAGHETNFCNPYSVLLNKGTASAIASTAKIDKYNRSGKMAPSPVSFRSSDLNPCTAYVNGSTFAIACSQAGNACTG